MSFCVLNEVKGMDTNMKNMIEDVKQLLTSKVYMIVVLLVSIGAYGFAVTHYAIGMDDTAVAMYYEDGLAPYVGRWTLYLMIKLLSLEINEFIPWTVEFISVLLLVFSATLWCALFKHVLKSVLPAASIPDWCCACTASVLISSPIISEVFVFYLHNGVCLGYGFAAIAVFFLFSAITSCSFSRKYFVRLFLSALFLALCLGCYESFVIVYMIGSILIYGILRIFTAKSSSGRRLKSAKLCPWLLSGLFSTILALMIHYSVIEVLKFTYDPAPFSVMNVKYRRLFGSIFSSPGEFSMVLKRFVIKYVINAITYLPIRVLLVSMILLGILSLIFMIRQKDPVIILCFMAIGLLPVLMSIVEGIATRYRSAQYVPIICAFAVFAGLTLICNLSPHKTLAAISALLTGILIMNQCLNMNKWFYYDYVKYLNAKEIMLQVAHDIKSSCDINKPIVFYSGRGVPYELVPDSFVSYSSKEFRYIAMLTDPVDVHWKEKYQTPYGYQSPDMPTVSILSWGVTAFDGTSQQLIKFWELHGISGLKCERDLDKINEAYAICESVSQPAYPTNGYIQEKEEYIIVNMGK